MNEEEIIKKCEDYENWKEFYNPNGIYQAIPLSKEHKQAIQGLLDLYNKEKEKNKQLEKENQTQRSQLNSAFNNGFIHKDKIKEIIKYIEEEGYWEFTTDRDSDRAKKFFEELLEE